MIAGRRAWVVLGATVVGVILTANLGAWQLRRAAEKLVLQEQLETRSELPPVDAGKLPRNDAQLAQEKFRQVHLRGTWLPSHNVYLDNRQMNAHVGFFLITPLQLEGRSDVVLVQRGWLPRDFVDRTRLAPVSTPGGTVEVIGLIAPPPAKLYEFANSTKSLIRQNIDLQDFSVETGLALLPYSVLEEEVKGLPSDGLLRQWSRPATAIEKHYGYAFQWFALAALMTGLYVWFQLLRPRWRHSLED